MRTGWLILILLCGCRDRPAPLDAELYNARVIWTTPAGLLRDFDSDSLPYIRLAVSRDVHLRWVLEGVSYSVTTKRSGVILQVQKPVPVGNGQLELVDAPTDIALKSWSARFTNPPNELPAIKAIQLAGKNLAAAHQIVQATSDPHERLWASRAYARLIQGSPKETGAAWLDAAQVAVELGAPSERVRRLVAAAYFLMRANDFKGADQALTTAEGALISENVLGAALIAGRRAVLQESTGEFRKALSNSQRSIELAERAGQTAVAQMFQGNRALLLHSLGQSDAALIVLDTLPNDANPLERVRLIVNRSWILFDGGFEGGFDFDRTRIRAGIQDALAQARKYPEARVLGDALANAAGYALADNRPADAKRLLIEAHAAAEGKIDDYLKLLDARLLTRSDPAAAAAQFKRVAESSHQAYVPWRAGLGRGRALLAAGDSKKALTAFKKALADLEKAARLAPLLGPRARLYASRRALVEETIALLLDVGEVEQAFRVADRSLARAVQTLAGGLRASALDPERRAVWLAARGALAKAQTAVGLAAPGLRAEKNAERDARQHALDSALEASFAFLDAAVPIHIASDQIPKLAADEALISFIRAEDGWRTFRLMAGQIEHRKVEQDQTPWTGMQGIRHVYVVPGSFPQALEIGPDRVAQYSVSYLPFASILTQPIKPGTGPAVFVADPNGDLPRAREEIVPKKAIRLIGRAATRATVLRALEQAPLFHFSGHGVLQKARPWEAHLRLAGGERLDLGDILTRRLAGPVVVLNGCETGTDHVLLRADAVGLPEAFVAAGATAVVATAAPIPDKQAARFTTLFYQYGGAQKPAQALQKAVITMKSEGLSAWRDYRLVGRRTPCE